MHQKCQSHLLSSVSESSSLHRERTWHVAPCCPWELPWGKVNTKPLKERHRCVLTAIFFKAYVNQGCFQRMGPLRRFYPQKLCQRKNDRGQKVTKHLQKAAPAPWSEAITKVETSPVQPLKPGSIWVSVLLRHGFPAWQVDL